jgi:hypothetical protein
MLVKIDAEGGELVVLNGMVESLQQRNVMVVMEYLFSTNTDTPHRVALELMANYGYQVHVIDIDGQLNVVPDVDVYLKQKGLDSDNLVFLKMQ